MTSALWNGYLVVEAGTKRYRGADRNAWIALGDQFYQGTLEREVERAYRALYDASDRGFGWPTAADRTSAELLLRATLQFVSDVELIATYSPYLERVGRPPWEDVDATPIGFDVVATGEWSLLGALAASEVSIPSSISLNSHGLLDDEESAPLVEALYRNAASLNEVEPIADSDPRIPVEPVRVGIFVDRGILG